MSQSQYVSQASLGMDDYTICDPIQKTILDINVKPEERQSIVPFPVLTLKEDRLVELSSKGKYRAELPDPQTWRYIEITSTEIKGSNIDTLSDDQSNYVGQLSMDIAITLFRLEAKKILVKLWQDCRYQSVQILLAGNPTIHPQPEDADGNMPLVVKGRYLIVALLREQKPSVSVV